MGIALFLRESVKEGQKMSPKRPQKQIELSKRRSESGLSCLEHPF